MTHRLKRHITAYLGGIMGALVLAGGCVARAGYTYTGGPWAVNAAIPDNDEVGWSDTRTLTTPITFITNVTVAVTLSGGWAGDLYGYVVHDTGFAVLLNRVGRALDTPDGSAADELTLVFNDAAAGDIHTALPMTGTVSGTYQPDARYADPLEAWDSLMRTAYLAAFRHGDANGEWTLFLADIAPGDTMTIESWSLTVSGIPEPGSVVALLACLCGALSTRRRSQQRRLPERTMVLPSRGDWTSRGA